MLPFVLVLFVAQTAFAAPSVSVSQYGINEISPLQDSGKLVSSYLTDRLFEVTDGADTNIYILTIQQILNDLANQPNAQSQALALGQAIATLGELATGVPGDACEAAAVINAYASAVVSGNYASLRAPLAAWVGRLQENIDLIVALSNNPNALRYSIEGLYDFTGYPKVGQRSNCAGGGRSYQFEEAWDAVLANSSPYVTGLVNEEYCAAKRLYNAFNVRSNNVGASVTAAALPPVTQLVQTSLPQLANFVRAVITGGNPGQAAADAKNALQQAALSLKL